jgi:hypothetical protein
MGSVIFSLNTIQVYMIMVKVSIDINMVTYSLDVVNITMPMETVYTDIIYVPLDTLTLSLDTAQGS